ncbi:hypothetical protein PV729_41200 [Streptomyces europaeiscabiei]|uniref:Integral membrane protein n=1 Tax=Streptomyces europaeiscabiei TaxID=146819 RepID=A0ABU4NWY1_9ACTN|nr:hypothetical protein [Streptomyces europaeiscabiei]MDX3548654.1 hypothetical protein [Streptomyces europaeiscabiei]MDX3558067.1 hypothetical protein [Streptomyces europaeiscabiei]MDX3706889.1 hypothetical protein [Streptomyces europaeiscabiei]
MQSESANENLTPEAVYEITSAPARGSRRKQGKQGKQGKQRKGSAEEGPVFVDNSGRRARLLRRCGTLLGVVCLGYAVVLGMAFMGWGISASPTQLFPFGGGGGGGQSGAPGNGNGPQPQGGIAPEGIPSNAPGGTPPSGVPTAVPSPSASAN